MAYDPRTDRYKDHDLSTGEGVRAFLLFIVIAAGLMWFLGIRNGFILAFPVTAGVEVAIRWVHRHTKVEEPGDPPGMVDRGLGRMSTREEVRRRRDELKRTHRVAFRLLSSIFFEEDPIGISFEDNQDEYEPEVGTVLPRLRSCGSTADVRRVVHEEFERWFGEDSGPPEKYDAIADRIWREVLPELGE